MISIELRTVNLIFIIAGLYDIFLGFISIFLIDYLSTLLDIPSPYPLLFPQVSGLFLIAVGYLLIYATKDIKKYAFIGFASLFVRYSFVFIVILTMMFQTVDLIFILLAFTDFITGTLLLVTFSSEEIDVRSFFKFR